MKFHFLAVAVLGAAALPLLAAQANVEQLEEIVISASLRPTPPAELPQSVTVLDGRTLRAAGVQHFEEVLTLIPNLSWASGTSRPRYFLLRCIGEIEQYQGAPNPSVGFLIDDIDFSGVGMPATLFDLDHVEVLRGPQGTAYGANALAGLISVRTRDPGAEFDLHGEATTGDFATRAAGAGLGDGFDGGADWGNDPFWGARTGYAPYNYFEQNLRRRRTIAEDLRFIGDDAHELWGRVRWLAGAYFLRLTESDDLLDTWNDQFNGVGSSELLSQYRATNLALYTAFDTAIGARSALSLGLRGERRIAKYGDTADARFPSAADNMSGGNLSWSMRASERDNVYITLARGYKAGGFNIGPDILPPQRRFQPEYLWSLETGLKRQAAASPLQLQAALFYMRRQNMQAYTSQQLDPSNPATFVFFTQNIAQGENYGLEIEAQWQLDPRWRLSGSAGLLRTRYLGFQLAGLAIPGQPPLTYSPDGRAQAYAPGYQLSVALEYRHPAGWFVRTDWWAGDGFYFSASHNQVARAYELLNLRAGYQHDSWTASVWVRNLFNQRYAVNGFYFGDDPPDFSTKLYLQNGNPRQIGLTISYDLDRQKE